MENEEAINISLKIGKKSFQNLINQVRKSLPKEYHYSALEGILVTNIGLFIRASIIDNNITEVKAVADFTNKLFEMLAVI